MKTKASPPQLVTSYAQVRDNAGVYMTSLNHPMALEPRLRSVMRKTASMARKWFILDGGLVVPAKFGGYVCADGSAMMINVYDDFRETHMHGSRAENAILSLGKVSKATAADRGHVNKLLLNKQIIPHEKAFYYRLEEIVPDSLSAKDISRTAGIVEVIMSMQFDDPEAAYAEIAAQLS